MEYDSPQWRAHRDAMLERILRNHEAMRFLKLVMEIGEQWDDVVDGDMEKTPRHINRLLWLAIVELQLDPFYARHREALLPVMIVGMNAWMDSTDLEKGSRQERAIAYGLRDFHLELIGMCIFLLHGYEAMRKYSAEIRQFLMDSHETIDDFLEGKP